MNKKYQVLRCGRLYDGVTQEWKSGQSILVEDHLIAEVDSEVSVPEGADIIDLSDCQVTPGMIDAHMHMDYFDWHTVREEVYTQSEEAKTLAIARCAEKALCRGFTTVRHVGGITSNGYGVLDVKRAIEQGYFPGSRIVAAPMFLCSAGSHGDLSQGFARNPLLSQKLQQERLTLGAGKDYFVNAVREQVKYGSDFLKIMATGGFFTPYDTPIQQQLNDEELKAIMDTAHALGKTVTAHVYTNELMQKLIAFGIDGMEHGSLMNRETAQLIEEKGLYLVLPSIKLEELTATCFRVMSSTSTFPLSKGHACTRTFKLPRFSKVSGCCTSTALSAGCTTNTPRTNKFKGKRRSIRSTDMSIPVASDAIAVACFRIKFCTGGT